MMKAIKPLALVLVLLMTFSLVTVIVPIHSDDTELSSPEEKISPTLADKTTSDDEVDVLVGYGDEVKDLKRSGALNFAERLGNVMEVYEDLNIIRIKIIGTSILELAKNELVANIWSNDVLDVKPLETSSSSVLADEEYESIVDLIGARDIWDMGYNGSGIVLAVLDTGIDSGHPDLDDFDDNESTDDTKVAAYASFVEADSLPTDILGSGTYAAAIAAGTGNASEGHYSGIAPGATLLAGKVTLGGLLALPSWIVSGIEWASSNGADIILLPFNTFGAPNDAVSQAVKAAVEKGIFVVAAAGDDGPDYLTIMSPGGGLECFTVGAYDTTLDEVPAFSGRGPSLSLNTKPDLVAPGVDIVGANIGTGLAGFGLGDVDLGGIGAIGGLLGGETGEAIDDYYKVADTTAASAAIVAGAAALLMEAFDRATPIVVGNVLRDTATMLQYGANDAGAGLLNLPEAFEYLSRRQDPIDPHSRTTGSALLALGFLSASGNNASSTLMMSSYGTSTLVMDARENQMDIHMLMGTLSLKWNDMDPTSLMNFDVKRELHGVTLTSLTGLLGGLGGIGDLTGGEDGGLLGGLPGGLGGLLTGGGDASGYGRWIGILSYDDEIFVTLLVESYNFTVNSTLPLTAFKITPFILNMGTGVIDNVSLYLGYSLDLFSDDADDHGKYSLDDQMLFAYGISEDYRDFYIGINSSRDLDAFEVGNSSEVSSHITDDNLTDSTTFDGPIGLGMKWDFGRIYPNNPVNVSIAVGFGENRTVLDASMEAMWTARPPSSFTNQADFILVETDIPRTAQADETYHSRAIIMNIGANTSEAIAAMALIKEDNSTGKIFAEYFTFDEIDPFHAMVVESEWKPEEEGIHTALWVVSEGLGFITTLLSDLTAITGSIFGILDDTIQRDVFVIEAISSASVFPKVLPFGPFDVRFPIDFGMYTIMLSTTLELGNLTVENVGNASDWGNATLTPAESVTGFYNFSLFVLVPPITMDGFHRCDYVLNTDHGWTDNVSLERVVEYPRAMILLDTSHGGGFGSLLGDAGGFGDIGSLGGNDTGGGISFPAFSLAQDIDTGDSGFGDISDLGSITDLFESIRLTTFSGLSELKNRMAERSIEMLELPGSGLDDALLSQVSGVMVISPTEEFNSTDIDTLKNYTASGGKLIVFGDNEDRANLTGLNPLLMEYGYLMSGDHNEENTTEIVVGSLLGSGADSMWLGGGTYILNNQSKASVTLNGRPVVLVDDSSPEIVLFGSSRVFMNKNLVKCNNSIILNNLIEYLLGNTLTCVTSLAENTTQYVVGRSVYLNLVVTDYYGDRVNDLFVAIAFELPSGNLSFFIAGFVDNGLYSSQFLPSYWNSTGRIHGIFILLREEYAGTYASIVFDLYLPPTTNVTIPPGPLLTMVQVAFISSVGIFGGLIYGLVWNRRRSKRRMRIPEVDVELVREIDNSLNTLLAAFTQMEDLIKREDLDKIQKIETIRGMMVFLERALKEFEKVSDKVGGV
ncbi:MAG: S8 family serine peptidase [Candidatus Thorarchaeota archaeon]